MSDALPPSPWRWLRRFAALMVWLAAALVAALVWFAWDLPDPATALRAAAPPPRVTVLDAAGDPLPRPGPLRAPPVALDSLPPYLPLAFLAVEDHRFHSHSGVDAAAVLRALWVNLRAGGVRQGGSTITQQLAKNLFLTPERTVRRKVQEALLALWLERRLSKDQILAAYLNRVYLGSGAHGVEAAARRYFGKPARELTLLESAVLAGLPRAPSRDNPRANPDAAMARARTALGLMARQGWITPAQAEAASARPLRLVPPPHAASAAPHFTDWVMARVESLVGLPARDMVVETTLEPAHQRAAAAALAEVRPMAESRGAGQAALVAMRPDGAVTAMAGGYDWAAGPFNRAARARRQPGSAFKVFVYLAGLESGLTPDSRVDDRRVTVEGWSPANAGGRHHGSVTLREGFARSLNTVAVAVSERAGRDAVARAARRLGVSTPLTTDPALALGVHEVTLLELAAAYTPFAGDGRAAPAWAIQRIVAADGTVLFATPRPDAAPAVSPRHVAMMRDMLRAAATWGTGRAVTDLAPPGAPPAYGKTGTSQNHRDAWFIGHTAADGPLVAGVWMGNDDASPMEDVVGGGLPARTWRRFMDRVQARAVK